MKHLQKVIAWALLGTVLIVAFWIRIQGVSTIPDGQFTGNDPYLYYWQAQIVSTQGRLPARDMHRWLPLGRDLEQTLNAYSYVLAYTHKAVTLIFRGVSLYQITLLAPVICFVIGLGILCFFLHRIFGLLFSSIVGVLLATLPGVIDRSTAGFSDRDSWCFLIGVLAITTYLASLQAQSSRWRILLTLGSGISMLVGGLSWEGFGVFLLVILVVEFWRFLTSEKEEGLELYLIWVLMFVPVLFLVSPAYQRGEGFATHLLAFVLVPPLVLFGMRYLRYILMTKSPWADKLTLYPRTLSLTLTLISLIIAVIYTLSQLDTFASTTVPLSQNPLMQNVRELNVPDYRYWVFRYGSVFFLGSIGLMIANIHLWKNYGTILTFPLVAFMLTTFFRTRFDAFLGSSMCNFFFFLSVVGLVVVLIFIAWRRNEKPKHELTYVAMGTWFLLWVTLSREALRYDFFIGVSITFFTAELICFGASVLIGKLKHTRLLNDDFRRRMPQSLLKASLACVMLAALMFWRPAGEHAKRSLHAATQMRPAMPGSTPVGKMFQWMKTELPYTSVVAARWNYGSQLNVLGGVKTIVDQDHYIQHWIHLYEKHVYNATDAREALEFLKTHRVTHLMVAQTQPPEVFLQGAESNAFVPVYPTNAFEESFVKVWEIHYPSDIKANLKYLATEPEK